MDDTNRPVQAKVPGAAGPASRAAAHGGLAQRHAAAGGSARNAVGPSIPGATVSGAGASARLASQARRKSALFGPETPQAAQRRPNRTGLPDRLKAGIERLSGLSMDHVRVRRNSSKPARLEALAYTQGSEIHVAPGQEKHLPHEAWHAAQQQQGRVKPTIRMDNVPVNDSHELEHEADVMGRRALQTPPTAQPDSHPPR